MLALVLLGPGLVGVLGSENGALLLRAERTVQTSKESVWLHRDEAQLATTAVALLAQAMRAPDTSSIDEAVLQRLAGGPFEDAGPGRTCRVRPPDLQRPS